MNNMKTKKWTIVLSVFGAFFRFCNAGAKGTVSYADDCPQGWAPAPISVQNEICYKKLNDTSKYNNGAKLCLEEDPRATMAMPKTDQEIKAVATKVLEGEYAWIGLNDRDDEGIFLFNDGDPLVLSDYRNKPWNSGSPVSDTNVNCVKVWYQKERSYKFIDENCSVKLNIVCQIDLFDASSFSSSAETTPSEYFSSASTPVASCCICRDNETPVVTSIDDIKEQLLIDKTTLSSFKRSKTSAEDIRISSRYIGLAGSVVIASVLGLIVSLDAFKFLKRCR